MNFKSLGILSLVGLMTLSLAACGTNKDISFADAQQIANKNAELLTQMIVGTTPNQQTLSLQTTIQDNDGMEIALTLSGQSEQDKQKNLSKRTIDVDANILNSGDTIAVSGSLLTLLNQDTLFLQVKELGLASSDPSLAMMSMMTEGIKGQRWKLPLEGSGAIMEGMNNYLSTLSSLQSKNAELYVEAGNAPYQGKFSQFSGKSAYQFTINQQKYQELLQEVLTAMDELTASSQLTGMEQAFAATDIQIPVFEGNLVILGTDDVSLVVDTMEIIVGEAHMIGEYRYGSQGMYMQLRDKATDQEILTIDIKQQSKKNYTLAVDIAEVLTIKGNVVVDLSLSQATLGFDGEISLDDIPELPQGKMTIPLKGTWSYKTIKSVEIQEPTDAIDLMELLGGLIMDDTSLLTTEELVEPVLE